MGGPRSGTWYRFNKRDTTDEHRSIDIRAWHRKGLLWPGNFITVTWSRLDEVTGSIGAWVVSRERVILKYRTRPGAEWQDVKEPVSIEWTPCNFGGARPWFRCPALVNGRANATPRPRDRFQVYLVWGNPSAPI